LQYGLRFSRYDYKSSEDVYYVRRFVGISDTYPSGYQLDVQKNDKNKVLQSYNNFEPRFNLKLETSESSSVKLSYNRMAQYIHLLSNTAASTPLDVWTSSTNNIKPQLTDQIALGFFKNVKDNEYEMSLEVYYKNSQNQVDYADRADLFLNPTFEQELLFGRGRAYGAEFFVKKNKGKLTGWASYTLARTERQIEGLNKGQWFPNRFDRTHTFNIVAQYELSKWWSLGANFALISGVPYSLPERQGTFENFTYGITDAGTRGNIRVPVYHRLDLSATKKVKKPLFASEEELVFSLYNAYNHRNPFSIYTQTKDNKVPSGAGSQQVIQREAIRLSIIGIIIPGISYNFKF
jgi:hypothetical protein